MSIFDDVGNFVGSFFGGAGDISQTSSASDINAAWDVAEASPSPAPAAAGPGGFGSLTQLAGLASTGLTAVGQLNTASATSEAATYNAQISDMNAALATQSSEWAAQTGTQQVQQSQLKTRQLVGGTIASQAAGGIDVDSQSAKDVRASESAQGAQDALNIRNSASRLAYGQEITAASDKAQAALDRSSAGKTMTSGYIGAGATVLGGLANPANNFLSMKQTQSLTGSGAGAS